MGDPFLGGLFFHCVLGIVADLLQGIFVFVLMLVTLTWPNRLSIVLLVRD